jgi:Ni/Fe-hydrogenase 1 B-type cytochrome subunit
MSTHVVRPGQPVPHTGRVYVWELPVRLTHWVNVLAIAVLSFTGYYIGNPFIAVSEREFYGPYFMGNMRLLHMIFGYILVASLLVRTYWAFFAGNQWASWRALVPFFTAEGRGYVKESLRYYLFLRREPPTVLGHNALAGFTYGIIVLLYFIQVITGFALYAQADPGGLWWTLTGWTFQIINNQDMRLIHHMIMWLLLAFMIHHVYSAFLVDAEEANGLMSSIFSGWKFIVPRQREQYYQQLRGSEVIDEWHEHEGAEKPRQDEPHTPAGEQGKQDTSGAADSGKASQS